MDLDIERIVVFAIIGAVIGVVGYKTGKITKENIIQWLLSNIGKKWIRKFLIL